MKKNKLIDLHIHSTFSDGILTPEQIVHQAKENNVKLIALTDHDTMVGVTPFLDEAEKEGIPALYGIEFSCQMNGRLLHILGYNFDRNNPQILELLDNFKRINNRVNKKRLANFERDFGYRINLDEYPQDGNITPVRLAYWLLETGQISEDEFPEKTHDIYLLFEPEFRAFEKDYLEELPLAETVVEIINKAKGFSILAHPQSMKVNFGEFLKLYARGLRGIEAFYPEQEPDSYLAWARKMSVAVSAGNDYHGVLDRTERSIGHLVDPELLKGVYLYTGDISI